MGNPFAENSKDLLVLDSRNLADPAVIDTWRQIKSLGQQQYDTYVNERLVNQTKPITDPINRNNLPLFSRPPVREKSRAQLQRSSLKNDCSLFSRLYIASQIRSGDLDQFFQHENQAYPPALSQMGKLRTGTKYDLVDCLENLVPSQDISPTPVVQVILLDGAAIINTLRPGFAKTFSDYVTHVFLLYITSQLQHVNRLDVVWDEYIADSLKAETRTRRGKGIRRRVEPSNTIPGNWQEFLRINDNKIELFSFLATSAATIATDKQVISTCHTGVLCTQSRDVSGLAPCTHEEADTPILLHLEDAVKQGYNKVSIRTVDTDVVVLAVASAQRLNIAELWIAFGAGKKFRYLPAHEMADALILIVMLLCQCFMPSLVVTRCHVLEAGANALHGTCGMPMTKSHQFSVPWLGPLERFVVLLYDRTSSQEFISGATKQLFTEKGRAIDGLPPAQAALLQHTKRAAY